MKTIAIQRVKEWRHIGMSDQSITNLINGLMRNKLNDKNMLLCLEIKKQLNINN